MNAFEMIILVVLGLLAVCGIVVTVAAVTRKR
jgi:Na+-transporting NADH:ubiquinone oxidoreductase subunit NqrC